MRLLWVLLLMPIFHVSGTGPTLPLWQLTGCLPL